MKIRELQCGQPLFKMQRADLVQTTQNRPLTLNLSRQGRKSCLIITAHNCATKHLTQQTQSQTKQSAMLSNVERSRSSTTGLLTIAHGPSSNTHWKMKIHTFLN